MKKRLGLFISVVIAVLFLGTILLFSSLQFYLQQIGLLSSANRFSKLLAAPPFIAAGFICSLVSFRFWPKLGAISKNHLLAILLLPIVLQIVAIPLYNISLWLFPPNRLFFELMKAFEPTGEFFDTIGAVLTIVVVGPIVEEYIFRGLMIERPLKEGFNIHLIVLTQALLFGLAHFNPWQFFYAVAFGIWFGYLRIWSGGILLTTILHILVNGITILSSYIEMPLIPDSTNDGTPIIISQFWVVGSLLVGFALTWFLYKNRLTDSNANLTEMRPRL